MKLKKFPHQAVALLILLIGIAATTGFYFSGKSKQTQTADDVAPEVSAQFNYIVKNSNSACYGIKTVMQMPDNGRIMGSCCGPMYLHTYAEQLESVEKYSSISKVPSDPYDIPVSQAKELINDFKTIQLSGEQQLIYEEAKKMSHEGGPCCCGDDNLESNTCWRWKVYGGLAKYLITEHGFSSEQIAEVWDVSDGCGGDHHVEEIHA